MEFWGVEVKAGQALTVRPDVGSLIHISQAALGEGKKEKGNDFIHLRVKINDEKFIVGSLSAEKFPQVTFDLVFEKEFELSHDWKNGSVYFCGYSADNPYAEDEDDFEDSDEDEDIPLAITENGKIESKVEEAKPAASKVKAVKAVSSDKPKVTVVEPKKTDEDDESDEDEDESDDDKDMMDASDDIDDSDDEDDSEDEDDSDEEDEETPKKVDSSKKRPTGSATKTPVPVKKAKLDTPQKTDGKKGGGHTATPYPSKQAGKTPNSNKSKEQTPKSDAKVTCKSCTKTFNSDSALQSHTKAKHAGK